MLGMPQATQLPISNNHPLRPKTRRQGQEDPLHLLVHAFTRGRGKRQPFSQGRDRAAGQGEELGVKGGTPRGVETPGPASMERSPGQGDPGSWGRWG